jgi:hypothetical protein
MSSSIGGVMRPEQNVELAFAQAAVLLRACGHLHHIDGNSSMSRVQPIEHGREQPHNDGIVRADSDFTDRRIGQELDVLDRLAQVVEHGHSTIEQGATILGRLGTLTASIEQPHADGLFQLRDRSRNGGLRGVQDFRRPAHAAGLNDGHQDVEVVQLHPASDAIA